MRLTKQPRYAVDANLVRFKRGWMKQLGAKVWGELDEYSLRLFAGPKARDWIIPSPDRPWCLCVSLWPPL